MDEREREREREKDVHTYIYTYIPTYIHTYTHTYMHTYTPTYIHTYEHTHTYIHACVLRYSRTYVLTYLRTYVPTYLRTYVLTYIRTYVRIYLHSGDIPLHACPSTCTSTPRARPTPLLVPLKRGRVHSGGFRKTGESVRHRIDRSWCSDATKCVKQQVVDELVRTQKTKNSRMPTSGMHLIQKYRTP